MAYPDGETREQSALSRSKRALIMLTGTYGPGDGAVWDVTPITWRSGPTGCVLPAAGQHPHSVRHRLANELRPAPAGQRPATLARLTPAGAGPAGPTCDGRRWDRWSPSS